MTFYCVADHAILSLQLVILCCEIQSRTSNCAFIPNSNSSFPDDGPIPKPQFSAVFIWRKIEIWFVTRWVERFYRVCFNFFLLHAASRRSFWNTAKSRPSGLWYRQQFLSICCVPPSFASVYSVSFGRFIFLFLLQTRTLVFFSGEMKKKLYLYWADYKFVIRFSSLKRVDLFSNEVWVLHFSLRHWICPNLWIWGWR